MQFEQEAHIQSANAAKTLGENGTLEVDDCLCLSDGDYVLQIKKVNCFRVSKSC